MHPDWFYLIDILFEIGPSESVGMGEGPITFQSIYYWQKTMRESLCAWEVRLLRKLSMLYLSERTKGEYAGAIRPWNDSSEEKQAEKQAVKAKAVSDSIKNMFGIQKDK